MIDRLQGFKPGEKVWVRSALRANEFIEVVIAPLARQAAYQAKPDYSAGKIVIMRQASGVIGKPVWFDFVFHDTASFRAFRASLSTMVQAEGVVRAMCQDKGFVWGGKACLATPQWQAYEAAIVKYERSRKIAAAKQPNAG